MADNTNPIKYSDLIKPDDSIDQLIEKLGILTNTYEHLIDVVNKDAKSMIGVLTKLSGATADGRKEIDAETKEAEKLAKANEALQFAYTDTAKELARLNELKKEQMARNREEAKMMSAQPGSYKALSAELSRLSREIDNQNPKTEEAIKLFKEKQERCKELADQMNKLKVAQGKYTLQVGNYAIAGESMKNVLMQGKNALNEMEAAGKKNSAEYQEMALRLAELKDQMDDTNAMIQHMSSDTWALDATLQAISVGTGGFAAATGAMQLFGGESKGVQEAQKKLQAAIAMVNGVTAIQNALQKQSALVTGIKKLFTKELTKETVENTVATGANTAAITAQETATKGATTATKGFGKALKALTKNPIMLIIAGLAAAVTGIIVLVDRHRRAEERLYQQQLKNLEVSEATRKLAMQGLDSELAEIQQKIKLAQAEGKSQAEILELQEQEFAVRSRLAAANTTWNKKEIAALDDNKRKRAENEEILKKAEAEQIKLKDYEIDRINAENALLDRQIEIAEEHLAVNKELEVEERKLAEQRRQLAIATEKAEEDSLRKLEDVRMSLIKNQFARERAETKANYARQRADLEAELKNDLTLTEKQRKNMTDLIVALKEVEKAALKKIDEEEKATNEAAMRETQNMRIALMDEGLAKERASLLVSYEQRTQDLRRQLETDTNLTTTQRAEINKQLVLMQQQYLKDVAALNDKARTDELNAELKAIELRRAAGTSGAGGGEADVLREIEIRRELELKANEKLTIELRQDEAAINAKYDMERMQKLDSMRKESATKALNIQQELAKSEIDLMRISEHKKNAEKLKLEKQALEQRLQLNKEANIKMSDEEVKTIENKIAKLNEQIKRESAPQDIWELMGLNMSDEDKELMNESFGYAKQALTDFYDYKLQLVQQSLDMANKEVEAAQNTLNAERQARAAGYANNVAMAEKELAAAKQQQRKILKQQQDTQKAQQKIQAIEQAVNMTTATAKIFGTMPIYLAIPAIALMWGAFIASKVKAKQLATEQYGEGTVELLQGGSHQSGNDIDLGIKKDGTRRRAEGGEFFAVINRRSSRKYRKEIPSIINSLNNGTFTDKYMHAYDAAETQIITTFGGQAELTSIAKDMREINERGRKSVVYTADGYIEKHGNITRIIKR